MPVFWMFSYLMKDNINKAIIKITFNKCLKEIHEINKGVPSKVTDVDGVRDGFLGLLS